MRQCLPAILGLVTLVVSDVTVKVESVKPLPLETANAISSTMDLLRECCPEEVFPDTPYKPSVLMSSYGDFGASDEGLIPNGTIFPSSGSLVRGAVDAWAQHQNLVIRPDEVWFEILAQLNFYMSAHAEEVRHLFVHFDGKKDIAVKSLNWKGVLRAFSSAIQQEVKTKWLEDWVKPGFSTSSGNDDLTATVMMMGLLKQYFSFSAGIICGLPSVTLLGERDDWVKLLRKLDRLPDFGEEPIRYASQLRPILTHFVTTFDEPESNSVQSFWRQIVRAKKQFSCGDGAVEYSISGWITGFLHWDAEGQLRVDDDPQRGTYESDLVIDGALYEPADLDSLPVGYAKAPLKMVDYPTQGEVTMAYLLAGNIGVKRTVEEGRVFAQPQSAWFLYGPVDVNYTDSVRLGSRSELERIADHLAGGCDFGGKLYHFGQEAA